MRLKGLIQGHLVRQMNALDQPAHLVDGFPMPVCKITRAYGSHCFKGEAAYGYCAAAKDEKFHGFEGQLLIGSEGVICGYAFAVANRDERDMLLEITQGLKRLLIGDKGYIRPSLKKELTKQALDLQTPLWRNMQDPRPKAAVNQLMKTGRLVETVIGQLTERFHIEKVRARDTWHLTNRFIRKLLAHTVGVFLNHRLGNPPLHFEVLVEV